MREDKLIEIHEESPKKVIIWTLIWIVGIFLFFRMIIFNGGDVAVNAERLGRITATEIMPAILGLSLFYWIFVRKIKLNLNLKK